MTVYRFHRQSQKGWAAAVLDRVFQYLPRNAGRGLWDRLDTPKSGVRPLSPTDRTDKCVSETVNSSTASDRDLRGLPENRKAENASGYDHQINSWICDLGLGTAGPLYFSAGASRVSNELCGAGYRGATTG
jgi:hypothetical protein